MTKGSASSLHYWYNAENGQTVLEVVEQIEAWTHHDFGKTLQTNAGLLLICDSGCDMNIVSMEIYMWC